MKSYKYILYYMYIYYIIMNDYILLYLLYLMINNYIIICMIF